MMPAMAKARHIDVEARTEALREWAETSGINRAEYHDKSIGVVCAGTTYMYAREALSDKVSYFKLGMVNPLPVESLKAFAAQVGRLIVIEELDDIIETHCR